MIKYRKTDQGVEFFFDYRRDVDSFVQFVEAMQEPIRDPESDRATKRLVEIRDWAGARDPYGATAQGFLVRLFRREIDQRIYAEPQGPEFVLPLVNHGERIEDQCGVVVGTLDLVNLVNDLWQTLDDDPRGFDL